LLINLESSSGGSEQFSGSPFSHILPQHGGWVGVPSSQQAWCLYQSVIA
jgi:hypothetical protein